MTIDAIEQSTVKASKQNGVFPRDLEFYKKLDEWVEGELDDLDKVLWKKAMAKSSWVLFAGKLPERRNLGIESRS